MGLGAGNCPDAFKCCDGSSCVRKLLFVFVHLILFPKGISQAVLIQRLWEGTF